MCIIAYKPAGIDFPTWETLENCFDNNPDGAGFMFADEHGVHVHKGYMKWKEFKTALKPHTKSGVKYPFVLHFRITTHGGTKPEMTQPFPLSDDVKTLKKLSKNCNVGIAHNGIIPLTCDAKKISDTALFVKDYLTLLIGNNPKYYKNPHVAEMIEELIDSKMCILSNDGHVEILGRKWSEENGILYSNDSFKEDPFAKYYKYHKTYSPSIYNTDPWCYDELEEPKKYSHKVYDNSVDCHYWSTGLTDQCYGCPNEEWCFG